MTKLSGGVTDVAPPHFYRLGRPKKNCRAARRACTCTCTCTMEAPKPAAKYALSSFYTSRSSGSSLNGNATAAAGGDGDDRKRKITDKNLPGGLAQEPEFAAESAMYRDLLQMERKLDWTMTRKRVEVHDALQRIVPVRFSGSL